MTEHKFVCITDLEATCWNDGNAGKRHEMEIIEIGSVLVDAATLEVVSEFQSFIRPVRNPILSDFCKSLTTITQGQVDKAETFPIVYGKWIEWVNQVDDVVLASWGQYDLNQFIQDCTFHKELFTLPHINLKNVVATKMGWKPKGVGKAINTLGLKFAGTPHRGIDDARNIHKIIQRCMQ